MNMVNDSVIAKPTFEKVADTTLSDDSTKWHEDILQKFFEEVDYLPENIGADVVLSSVDTNKGYGKGSVVVWFQDKKINFPIIIKDYKLSPFDVFVVQDGDNSVYMPASFDNIKRLMSTNELGTLQNIWDKGQGQLTELKTPGGVYPKQLVDVSNGFQADPSAIGVTPFYKSSGWRDNARKEDLEKLADVMERNPAIKANYVDNTGDLITNVIDLAHSQKQVIADTNRTEDIDLNGLVSAKQSLTVIDSELFDVSNLKPVAPPSLCELRLYEFPTMEDFIERGDNMSERYMATKNGRPVVGIVVDLKEQSDYSTVEPSSDPNDKKATRQRRDQIFISVDGSCYSTFSDWNKTGIGFYGSKVVPVGSGSIDKVMKMISANTSDEFMTSNRNNRGDGSDKMFNPIQELNQGSGEYNSYGMPSPYCGDYDKNLAVIYGAGDAFECTMFGGKYRKISINGSPVYTTGDTAIIPANVASIQRVRSVDDEVYRMATLGAKKIFLIPESSVVFNTAYMRNYGKEDFMRPNLPLQKVYEDASISKVAVEVNPVGGYSITGEPYAGLSKIAGSECVTTRNAITSLVVMGMEKTAAENVLKHAINRYIDKDASDKKVTVYGVRGDYVNTSFNPHAKMEKTAKQREVLKKICSILRTDLIKEASAINDPEAVDVVLSLDFINEDSLKGYVENIDEMRRILSQLAQMLVASRLGLSDLDESALKKSIEGLNNVVSGLENIKLAIK